MTSPPSQACPTCDDDPCACPEEDAPSLVSAFAEDDDVACLFVWRLFRGEQRGHVTARALALRAEPLDPEEVEALWADVQAGAFTRQRRAWWASSDITEEELEARVARLRR